MLCITVFCITTNNIIILKNCQTGPGILLDNRPTHLIFGATGQATIHYVRHPDSPHGYSHRYLSPIQGLFFDRAGVTPTDLL
jgi:hypothetical protein